MGTKKPKKSSKSALLSKYGDASSSTRPQDVGLAQAAQAFYGDGADDDADDEDGPVVVGNMPLPTDEGVHSRIKKEAVGDEEPPRRKMRANSDEEPPRRRRVDSDDEEPPRRRKRADSDDEEPPRRRKRADSDDEEPPRRRKREDSDDSGPPRRRTKRSGSDSDSSPPRRKKDSSRPTKMSSGHSAGLQTGTSFSAAEAVIKEKKKAEIEEMVRRGEDGRGGTVYRDADGRVMDKEAAVRKEWEDREAAKRVAEAEAKELRTGRRQKEEAEERRREAERVKHEGFSRRITDSRIEQMRREVIRDGDPMAGYVAKKRGPVAGSRPVYKGPPGKPNRFGIKPGYRWDGVVRQNDFEDRVLAKVGLAKGRKEARYKASTGDM